MDFTTWLGMYLSGVGIGMHIRHTREAVRIWGAVIREGRHLPRIATVFCAAAIGATTPATRGAPVAAAASRAATTATLGSVV